jgi:hypothetical protein
MPIVEDVRGLIDRTNRDLDEWSDFLEHTKAVWRGFQFWVKAGNTFRARNAATGKEFSEADLTSLSQYYITEHLASFAFQRYISVFEAFVFDFLRILLLRNPGSLSGKELKFGAIVSKPDLATVVQEVIDHQLNEIRYAKPKDWFEFIDKVQRLGCPSADEVEGLAEIKATRDVLEHNAGVVTKVYMDKSGKKARFKAGEYVELPDMYLRDCWLLLKKISNDLANAAIKVFTIK